MQANQSNSQQQASWRTARALWPYLWRYRTRILIGLVCLILARVANVSVPLLLKQIIDHLDNNQQTLVVVPMALLIGYGALRFASILFNELRNFVFVRASVSTIRAVSVEVFEHLHKLSLRFHLDRKTGALSRDMERGTRSITSFMRSVIFSIIPTFIEIALVLGILLSNFDASFALITLLTVFIYSVFTHMVTRWRTHYRVDMNHSESISHSHALDSLLNFETVKVFGNEGVESKRYDNALGEWAKSARQTSWSLSLLNIGQALIIAVGLSILLIMAANGVSRDELTLGDFVMINAFLIQLYIPLNFLGSVYREINHALIDMHKLFSLLNEQPDIQDSPQAKALELSLGEVKFENINFAYDEKQPILKGIDFCIKGGQTVAIVGPSGSGKSTLSRLLLRFYDPQQGRILIDGQDIRQLSQSSLRAVMGVVPQDTVLFNDSIGYNIRYGRADASDEEVEQAAKLARIHDFIQQHPEGYNILVGERGLKLSGGEKQRVAIARTVLKGARILIFDEATSSLDTRSEKAIQQSLEAISQDHTTLVIAHRLSTIVNADQILVLDQGQIKERGTHAKLLKQSGLYAQMWAMQQQNKTR